VPPWPAEPSAGEVAAGRRASTPTTRRGSCSTRPTRPAGRSQCCRPRSAKSSTSTRTSPISGSKKSVTIFTAEVAAGDRGRLHRGGAQLLGIGEIRRRITASYFDGVRARRHFTIGRGRLRPHSCEGIWAAFTRDHYAALTPDGDWFASPAWGADLHVSTRIAEIGLPLAYARQGRPRSSSQRGRVLRFFREELLKSSLADCCSMFPPRAAARDGARRAIAASPSAAAKIRIRSSNSPATRSTAGSPVGTATAARRSSTRSRPG